MTTAGNTVPWADSFESYPDGSSVIGLNGWTGAEPGGAVATTAPAVVSILPGYLTGGRTYPLPSAPHANVLQTTLLVTNTVRGGTGAVVAVEFMVLPTAQPEPPPVPTNLHYAFFVNTSSNLVIWHQNRTGGVTNNEWRALTNGPAIPSAAWSRFTVIQDYGHHMFQLRVNEATNAVTDPAGWALPGGAPSGPWFHMVSTNAGLSLLMLGGDTTNYVDDLLLTNRCVTWSTNRFAEGISNDGSVEAAPAFTLTVSHDTFAGADGQVLTPDAATVTNLPAGLTGVVTRLDGATLQLALTGQAHAHEAPDSCSNITVVLHDEAFTLGNAASIDNVANAAIALDFANGAGIGTLTGNGSRFGEAAANDGSISNSLTFTLAVATFTNVSPLVAGLHYTVTPVPAGLLFSLTRTDDTTLEAHLAGNAAAHTAAASLTNLDLVFLDAAFAGTVASNILGSAVTLAVDFSDPPVLAYAATTFVEAPANDGTVTNTLGISLSGDTFTNAAFTSGVHYTAPAQPPGLVLNLVRTSPTTVTASLAGSAPAHAAADSLASIGFAFLDAAFDTVAASNIVGTTSNVAVSFADPPVLTPLPALFGEATNNDGSIAAPLTITLAGDTLKNEAFVADTHYTAANIPDGLTLALARASATQITATLSGQALDHRAADTIANLTITFLDAAFDTVRAANIDGHPLTLAVTFDDQPALTYSREAFVETAGGVIDNRTALTITLAGDTFAADAAGRITVANLPGGLTAAFARDSATQLSVRLDGAATLHAAADSIANLTFTFEDGAFASTGASHVDNRVKNNLRVTFGDEVGFFNVIPYGEPYEDYLNGFWLAGTNGWTADFYADAGIVDDDADVTANLRRYLQTHEALPLVTNHVRTLTVQDSLRVAIHSETNRLVYVDFMTQPVALQEEPESNTNAQYAFYVGTNAQLVVWHCNRTGAAPTNEWLTLQGGPLIDTSRWVRFTVAQDYEHNLFQLRVNEHDPIVDAAGWTEGGASPTGSWFHMVQTNGTLSAFVMSGTGQSRLDDLTVRTSLPSTFGGSLGSVFKFR